MNFIWQQKFNWSHKNSPVECYKVQIIGTVYVFIFIASLFANSYLLFVFYKNKQLRNPMNHFIIILAVLNFLTTLFHMPFVITNAFMCE
jgi:ABC-type multidrug transport system permease subunit